MKIAHLTYSDTAGGAAIGAYRLHQAMLSSGLESHMFVIHKGSNDPRVYNLLKLLNREEQKAGHKVTQILKRAYGAELPIRSFNLFGVDTSTVINSFAPDIVQLHWIANNTIRLEDLRNISAPLVWKMPDMWPFCGGEHYLNADEPPRHRIGYDLSQPTKGEQIDIDRFVWEYKRQCYANLNLTITSPSRFLAREAHESQLLSRFDCHVIPNPFPAAFRNLAPLDAQARAELRTSLGLPNDRMVVMFAAYQTGERRKGFHHIAAMLEYHLPKLMSPSEVCFMVVGGSEAKTEPYFDYTVKTEPNTSNIPKYISYLQASDLVLFPSEMDSTAMVVGEGLACGVPAVTFAVGGLIDLVHHKKSGYLATPYDPADLANGIVWWRDHQQKDEVASYCRALVRSMHDQSRAVERYTNLYESLLARARTGQPSAAGTLYDREAEQIEQDAPRQLLIVDPSVKDILDSSHNTEAALAAAALATIHGIEPRIIANQACAIPGMPIDARFAYTAYDKLRAGADDRGNASIFEDVGHLARAERTYAILDGLITGKLTARDAVFFPMIDRPSIDGLLLYLVRHDSTRLPSFHLHLMFEHAEFLVGEYPLRNMLRALRNTGYVGRKIFLYAETAPMTKAFARLVPVKVEVLPPLPLLDPDKLREVADLPPNISQAFEGPYTAFHATSPSGVPEKKPGEIWVSSLGRGRRDKGWDRLPAIVEATRKLAPNSGFKFVVQRPRKMDALDAEVELLSKDPDVILLDEILDNSVLEAVTAATDLVLLPYDRRVYNHRGSAFAWKAVASLIPMVVTRETALPEAILWENGLPASTDEEFAAALVTIRDQIASFKQGAERALRVFLTASVAENPVIRNVIVPRAVKRETILAIGLATTEMASLANAAERQINVVRLVHRFTAGSNALDLHPEHGDTSTIVLSMDISSDASSLLPQIVRETIAAGRFREIVLGAQTPAGMRDQLLACGASAAIIRTPARSSLAARPKPAAPIRRAAPSRAAAPVQARKPATDVKRWLASLKKRFGLIPPPPKFRGCIDGLGYGFVKGWVLDEVRPGERLAVEVRVDGAVVAKGLADIERRDLRPILTDHRHGFQVGLPKKYFGTEIGRIAVHVAGKNASLRLSKGLDSRLNGSPVQSEVPSQMPSPTVAEEDHTHVPASTQPAETEHGPEQIEAAEELAQAADVQAVDRPSEVGLGIDVEQELEHADGASLLEEPAESPNLMHETGTVDLEERPVPDSRPSAGGSEPTSVEPHDDVPADAQQQERERAV